MPTNHRGDGLANRHRADAGVSRDRARFWPRFATDDRLVSLVRRGDATAFEILYDRHARELLSFCSYILGSRHDAEDAVQATFASAYRALIADDRRVELRPWLFSIARNASLSIVRKRQPTAEIGEASEASEDPVAQVEQRESLRQVVATMLELPERQRTALVLAELHGLSHNEIGTVLDVPAKKVKAYIYQARSSLISERTARDALCSEIRQELATARGAMLLKGKLRRHVRSCEGCRDYAAALSRQRGQIGVLVPLAPTLALKRRVLDAATGSGGGLASGAGGATVGASLAGTGAELAGAGVKALVAKVLVGVAGVGVGTGAGTLALSTAAPSSLRPVAQGRAAADAPRQIRGSVPRGVDGRTMSAAVPLALAATPTGASRSQQRGVDRRSQQATTQSFAADSIRRGNGAAAHGGGMGHGKSAEAHGGSTGRGKSGESHGNGAAAQRNGARPGKSGEHHASGAPNGKSGEAHGKLTPHGKGIVDGHGVAPGKSGAARSTGPSATTSRPAGNAGGGGAGTPKNAGANTNANANANGNSASAAGQSAGGHGEPASPPPAPAASPAGSGTAHGQGQPGASGGAPHDASGAPQKP
jgi:RNA polymerase sigma factor (sigma-70 family)